MVSSWFNLVIAVGGIILTLCDGKFVSEKELMRVFSYGSKYTL
jgi:hypothetical protein